MGGEEFVIVLPDTPLKNAAYSLARIQKTQAEQALKVGTQTFSLRFSDGLTQYESHEDMSALLEAADAGVCQAKKPEKNRMTVI